MAYENSLLLGFQIEVRLDIENINLIAIDEKVKMSKRKLISHKNAVEDVLQFVEEGEYKL